MNRGSGGGEGRLKEGEKERREVVGGEERREINDVTSSATFVSFGGLKVREGCSS